MSDHSSSPHDLDKDVLFCPYLGHNIPLASSSLEHVIPLSLGGADGFSVRVDRQANSKLGHMIDGAQANDPIFSMQRALCDCRGHSNKPVTAIWKNTQDAAGRPLQAIIGQRTLDYFDPRSRRMLTKQETAGQAFTTNFKFELLSKVPFSAKVALGTGHFVFGPQFEKICRCGDFRQLFTQTRDIPDKVLRKNRVTYLDPINDLRGDRQDHQHVVLEGMIRRLGCSAVIITNDPKHIVFTIGILGEWFSTISIPAKVKLIPCEGEFDRGHVIILKDRKVHRTSFRTALTELAKALNIPIPPASPVSPP